jgi:RHH-type proline utilization regulon transcriptional repressor/proline dehydrogenase/delta 1-pyrroline-5-carboxylate dehydrogenase
MRWPVPVWQEKWQSDACYERMTRALLENHAHIYTALGSHNVRSLAHGRARTADPDRRRVSPQCWPKAEETRN